MKIIVIGGTGVIGKAVVAKISQKHDVISVGATTGDEQVDITDLNSIAAMYKNIGAFDALAVCAGKVHFAALEDMTAEKYEIGLKNKLMGAVNLVLIGQKYINDHGSFTLTSGILNRDPIPQGSSAAMVNGALDAFVKAAACELNRGIRINIVSPTVVVEAMHKYADYFPGFEPVAVDSVANAYIKSIAGVQTGQVYCVP